MALERSRRIDARQGYDLWSETYDETPNPVVAMDVRHTLPLLAAGPGERILDAGCGTGRNFETMLQARNHLGLLSEDTHPLTGEMWGNFPQTYSMVGLINCAVRLSAPWDNAI